MRTNITLALATFAIIVPAAALAAADKEKMKETCDGGVTGKFNPNVAGTDMGPVSEKGEGYAIEGRARLRDGSSQNFTCIFDGDGDLERVEPHHQTGAPGGSD